MSLAPLEPASDHYVSDLPYRPGAADALTPEQERYFQARPALMMWWRFRRHKPALIAGIVLLVLYVSVAFVEFLAPYGLDSRHSDFILAPPQRLRLLGADGSLIGPHVDGLNYRLDMKRLRRVYTADPARPQPVRFVCHGDRYRFWGLVDADLHLLCPAPGGTLFLLGTDRLGRDMLSRLIYGMRISLTVGLIGIAISLTLGVVLGGVAGYYGGWVDLGVQRLIEVLRSFPELPLWMALSAALPVDWSPVLIYFGITVILGLLDWTGLARAVRSKFLALREEDFCTAARLMGASPARIIGRHLLPSFLSHLIASATLSIPGMILGETALSFLGLGLRPPITSWGVLLAEAQNINVVVIYPWLLAPVVAVMVVVLSFNFLGDGLRDAADPYSR